MDKLENYIDVTPDVALSVAQTGLIELVALLEKKGVLTLAEFGERLQLAGVEMNSDNVNDAAGALCQMMGTSIIEASSPSDSQAQ